MSGSAAAAAAGAPIPAAAAPTQSMRVPVRFRGREVAAQTDLVTVEEPLEVRLAWASGGGVYREQSIAVTMRTPGEDFDLVRGFLFAEGVVRGPADLVEVACCGPPSPDKGLANVVKATLAAGVPFDPQRLSRHVFTSSSCGVCGKASLDAVRLQLPSIDRRPLALARDGLGKLPQRLRELQAEFGRTGGLHAAASFDGEGRILRLREDVGRHNALDKLIGAYLGDAAGVGADDDGPTPPLGGLGILLSGRASFELLQKAAMSGVALVAALGPPSSLAIELAKEAGIALAGFLKAASFNVYADPHGFL